MMTILDPMVPVWFGIVFGVPITAFAVGVIPYFLKPNLRKITGKILIAFGSLMLIASLMVTRNLTWVGITLYTVESTTIITGILSLSKTLSKEANQAEN